MRLFFFSAYFVLKSFREMSSHKHGQGSEGEAMVETYHGTLTSQPLVCTSLLEQRTGDIGLNMTGDR